MRHAKTIFYIGLLCVALPFQNCSKMDFAAQQKVQDPNGSGNGLNTPGGPSRDVFTKTFTAISNKVDILIVDDNSGSMSSKQQSLATRFNNFLTNLGNIDWQIGVTSTDVCIAGSNNDCPNAGGRGQFFGPQGQVPMYSPSYVLSSSMIATLGLQAVSNLFYQTVQRNNEQGSGDERGIYAANLVIDNRFTSTAGFFRDGADLAVIVVSDEDERSVADLYPDPQRYPLEPYDLPETLIKKVNDTWGGNKSLLVNAIVELPNDAVCDAGGKHPGTIYISAAQMTGGIVGGCVNSPDVGAYTTMITNIGTAISKQNLNIVLNHTPLSQPVVTWIPAANAVPVTWNAGTNVMVLGSYPIAGTQISVSYQY